VPPFKKNSRLMGWLWSGVRVSASFEIFSRGLISGGTASRGLSHGTHDRYVLGLPKDFDVLLWTFQFIHEK